MVSFTLKCIKIWQKYGRDEVTVYAAQASFFLVLAFFPFIMLLLTLIQFIPSVNKSDLQAILVRIMPDMLDALVLGIVDDLYLKSPGTMLSVTALLALWSASRGMMGIERGLNRIYGFTPRRNYLFRRLVCTGYTLIFVIVCVVSLTLLVFGNSLQGLFVRVFPFLERFVRHVISFRSLLSILLFLSSFVFLYSIVPAKKQDPWQQLPGAIFAAICWLAFSFGFSLYFSNFSNFSYMYGSLAAIVLLMFWLYFCICILFIGAEINASLQSGAS
ncbi:YihY/virulence factor BrkB family protein [Clostridiaceae bacterium]|nr:YihY/virulence factor BrkB family protein [Clostridiaceae bacterium]RKI07430.1 YihY/virulence factor BrkB family protein [bacterium 1XD21-70]